MGNCFRRGADFSRVRRNADEPREDEPRGNTDELRLVNPDKFVIVHENKIIAQLTFQFNTNKIVIADVHVLDDFTRTGLGTVMVSAIISSCTPVSCTVPFTNEIARRFFAKLRFEEELDVDNQIFRMNRVFHADIDAALVTDMLKSGMVKPDTIREFAVLITNKKVK